MSYYDDWVDPNALFKERGKPRKRGRPKRHLAAPVGCGVDVRVTDDPEKVTCLGCLKRLEAV